MKPALLSCFPTRHGRHGRQNRILGPAALVALFAIGLLGVPARASKAAQPAGDGTLPEQAFAELGERFGCRFALAEGEHWIGADAGVRVRPGAGKRSESFWETVLRLSEQTGYEPVFEPYGAGDDGLPVIRLRRVDVRAEETPRPAVAAGPMLVRPRRGYFTIPLSIARIRVVPVQVGLETEVFLEPGVRAVYVSATGLRGQDEEGVALRAAGEFDPTARVERGTALLTLRFDAPGGIPAAVAQWRGLFRVVDARELETMTAPLVVVPEPPPATQPTTAPADDPRARMPEATSHALGPYAVSLEPAMLSEPPPPEAGGSADEPGERGLTVSMTLPRGEMPFTEWSRLYGFLATLPPRLEMAGDGGGALWGLASYAVFSPLTEETRRPPNPQEGGVGEIDSAPGLYRVWARYRAPAGTAAPARLVWELPVASEEQRAAVVWRLGMVVVEPPAGAAPQADPATRPIRPGGERSRGRASD